MLEADFYDGQSSTRYRVRLRIDAGALCIDGDGCRRSIPLRAVVFGEPLGRGPRCIELPGGARCEVADLAGLSRLMGEAGAGEGLVVRLQRRWRWALLSLALIVGGAVAGYLWGLPAAARLLAPRVPPMAVKVLSDGILAQLDRQLFTASRLPAARQNAIREQAARSLAGSGLPPWRIQFRESRRLGANAIALPAGDIVILDGLVGLMDDDRQIVAVVAHEIGHLAYRHSMRQLIEGAAVSLVIAAWLGDVSSAAVSVGVQLLQSGYSRDSEREADAFAIELLRRCCGSAEPLADALERLTTANRDHGGATLFDSHPDTAARIAAIRTTGAGN